MDDITLEIVDQNPWPKEEINSDSMLFRQIGSSQQNKANGRRFPNATAFLLRPNEESLSVNWEKYISAKGCYHLIGLRYTSSKQDFLNPKAFHVFQIPSNIVDFVSGIERIEHDPVYFPNPEVGRTNNRSHSSIFYSELENNEQLRLNLSTYCCDNYAILDCEVNKDEICQEVEELRRRLTDTKYHSGWDFKSEE